MNSTENINKLNKPVSLPIVTLTIGLLTAVVMAVIMNGYVDFKSAVSKLSALENYNISSLASVASADISTTDKWHPGIYAKVEEWQLNNPTQMEKVYQDLETTPALRGIKVEIKWGKVETRDVNTGISTYDFTQINSILSRLETMDNKHLIIIVPWREFKATNAADILPNDMRGGQLWSEDPVWEHMDYDYLWAYKMSNQLGKYAYNLKLWDPEVKSRFDAFMAALANAVDSHPNFNQITTSESALGEPVIPFVAGESEALQYDGQIEIIRSMKRHFTNSYVVPALNFSRQHVANAIPIIENEIFGLGSPNSNKQLGLNSTGTYPGVLTYYPTLSGKIILAPEIQGDDYQSTYGGSDVDNPPYDYLYKRVRDDLKANYTVMQRNYPYWYGSSTASIPSVLEFLQTYPDIVNDPTGAGGLNHIKPAILLSPDLSFSASPTEVYSGESSVLAWSATNSTTCEASGAWSGTKALEGVETINNIFSTSTYTLSCTGVGGSAAKNVTVGIKADTESPTIPGNLTSVNVNENSVTLNWSSSTDNIAVTGYNVYRDGVKLSAVTDTTYTDSSLSSGSTYVYAVTAVDSAGNESLQSVSLSITTVVVIPFEINTYGVSNITKNSAIISTSLSKLGSVTINYSRWSGNLHSTRNSSDLKTDHTVTLNNLERDKTYYYQITATDEAGKTVTSPIASFKTRKN